MTLSSTGLEIQTLAEIKAEIEAEIVASPHLNPRGRINLAASSVLGQIISIVSDRHASNQQLMQAVYASAYKSSAEGASLDAVAELVGLTRNPASASTVELRCSGLNGTIITAGSLVRDPDRTEYEFEVLAPATITSGTATVDAQCTTTGVLAFNAETLTEIVTPIAGWSGVTNDADATIGTADEADAALRLRMTALAFTPGSGTTAAIRSALYNVAGVTEAYVFENTSGVTDSNDVPAKCIEAVVEGGDDADIAEAIFANKPCGIGTYSDTSDSGSATDGNGDSVTINFSRPVAVDVYVYVKVLHDGNNPDVESEIKTAVAAYGDQILVGQDVIRSRFFSVVHSVSGVLNVQVLGLSRSTMPTEGTATDDDVDMAFRESPIFDTANVDVDLVTA